MNGQGYDSVGWGGAPSARAAHVTTHRWGAGGVAGPAPVMAAAAPAGNLLLILGALLLAVAAFVIHRLTRQNAALRAAAMAQQATVEQQAHAERKETLAEVAGMVAHEIRNPLNTVKTAAYFIESRISGQDERVDRHLATMSRQIEHADGIIQDLLDYSDFPLPAPERVDASRIVRQTVAGIRTQDGVQIHMSGEESAFAFCDAAQLARAVRHLICNGVQSLEGPGEVRVSVIAEDGRVQIEVADTGRGIQPADRERVFDPLFSTKTRGAGLGLTITRLILQKNGGGVTLADAPGSGSVFRAWVPAAGAEGAGLRAAK